MNHVAHRSLIALLLLCLVGCANPNGQGLQDFGTITGRLIDDKSGAPISVSPIYLTVGGRSFSNVDNQGGFVLNPVPIGQQIVTVTAIGYQTATTTINVLKNETSPAGDVRLRASNS